MANDFLSAISGFARGAAPGISRNIRESRAERRRRERENELTRLFMETRGVRDPNFIGPPVSPEQAGFKQEEARAQLFGLTGQQLPATRPDQVAVNTPAQIKNYNSFLTALGIADNDPLRGAAGLLPVDFLTKEALDRSDIDFLNLTESDMQKIIDGGGGIPGVSAKQQADAFNVLTQKARVSATATAGILGFGEGTRKPRTQEDIQTEQLFRKIDAGEELTSAADRALLDDIAPTTERRNFILDKKGNAFDLYKMGLNSIQAKGGGLFFGGITFSQDLLKWKKGELTASNKSSEKAYLDKYYDRTTLEIKPDAAIDEALIMDKQLEQLNAELNIPKNDTTAQDIVTQLLANPGAEPNRAKIQVVLDRSGSKATVDDIIEMYEKQKLVSAGGRQ